MSLNPHRQSEAPPQGPLGEICRGESKIEWYPSTLEFKWKLGAPKGSVCEGIYLKNPIVGCKANAVFAKGGAAFLRGQPAGHKRGSGIIILERS